MKGSNGGMNRTTPDARADEADVASNPSRVHRLAEEAARRSSRRDAIVRDGDAAVRIAESAPGSTREVHRVRRPWDLGELRALGRRLSLLTTRVDAPRDGSLPRPPIHGS